ncbi:MAG: hypothetical protein SGPRY_012604 [Prymnesium sp.]
MLRRLSSPLSLTCGAEEEPLLQAIRASLQQLIRAAAASLSSPVTEAIPQVEPFCDSLEAVLAHSFKTRQFYVFSVHPWALAELSERQGPAEAEAVALSRAIASADEKRLRAWMYVHLNRGSLESTLSCLTMDQSLLEMMYLPSALMLREETRMMLLDLLRQLSSLSFNLGAALGLSHALPQPHVPTGGGCMSYGALHVIAPPPSLEDADASEGKEEIGKAAIWPARPSQLVSPISHAHPECAESGGADSASISAAVPAPLNPPPHPAFTPSPSSCSPPHVCAHPNAHIALLISSGVHPSTANPHASFAIRASLCIGPNACSGTENSTTQGEQSAHPPVTHHPADSCAEREHSTPPSRSPEPQPSSLSSLDREACGSGLSYSLGAGLADAVMARAGRAADVMAGRAGEAAELACSRVNLSSAAPSGAWAPAVSCHAAPTKSQGLRGRRSIATIGPASSQLSEECGATANGHPGCSDEREPTAVSCKQASEVSCGVGSLPPLSASLTVEETQKAGGGKGGALAAAQGAGCDESMPSGLLSWEEGIALAASAAACERQDTECRADETRGSSGQSFGGGGEELAIAPECRGVAAVDAAKSEVSLSKELRHPRSGEAGRSTNPFDSCLEESEVSATAAIVSDLFAASLGAAENAAAPCLAGHPCAAAPSDDHACCGSSASHTVAPEVDRDVASAILEAASMPLTAPPQHSLVMPTTMVADYFTQLVDSPRPTGKLAVHKVNIRKAEVQLGLDGKRHTIYQLRARIGPFECTTHRRYSDFIHLQVGCIDQLCDIRPLVSALVLILRKNSKDYFNISPFHQAPRSFGNRSSIFRTSCR